MMEQKEKPYVICHMLTSLDGKIDGEFFSAPECLPALQQFSKVRIFYGCSATIYGTTTMEGGYADGRIRELPKSDPVYPHEDYIAGSDVQNYIVSLDPNGILAFNCKLILVKLKELFGISKLMVSGGGLTNWSFTQENLIDELSLIIAPVADGSRETASIFEKAAFLPHRAPAAFTLKYVEQIDSDTL